MYRPVCGTDGKTYERECQLEKVSCETFGDVELDHYGECESQMLNDGGMGGFGWGGLPMWGGFGNDFEEDEVEETCENIDCAFERDVAVCGEYRGTTQVYINACTMRAQSCKLDGTLDGIKKVGKPKGGKCKSKKPSFQMFGGRFPVFGRGRFGRDTDEEVILKVYMHG